MTDLFGHVAADASISPCGTWRYRLTRSWDAGLPSACWVMLNPSTADGELDDPTIRRCIGFSRAWGYGGLAVGNLFALRSTDPDELASDPDPVGADNDCSLIAMALDAALVVCAWGAHRMAAERSTKVVAMLSAVQSPLWCLGTTKAGAPRHPLYVPATARLMPYGLRVST